MTKIEPKDCRADCTAHPVCTVHVQITLYARASRARVFRQHTMDAEIIKIHRMLNDMYVLIEDIMSFFLSLLLRAIDHSCFQQPKSFPVTVLIHLLWKKGLTNSLGKSKVSASQSSGVTTKIPRRRNPMPELCLKKIPLPLSP